MLRVLLVEKGSICRAIGGFVTLSVVGGGGGGGVTGVLDDWVKVEAVTTRAVGVGATVTRVVRTGGNGGLTTRLGLSLLMRCLRSIRSSCTSPSTRVTDGGVERAGRLVRWKRVLTRRRTGRQVRRSRGRNRNRSRVRDWHDRRLGFRSRFKRHDGRMPI